MTGVFINMALVCLWAVLYGLSGDSEYLAALAISAFFVGFWLVNDR